MKSTVTIGLALLCTFSAQAADWPQFQGPSRTGVSPETNLLKSFPAEGPKVLWETKLEKGFGGCAVVGDEVFLVDRVMKEKDMLLCLNLKDGKEKWRYESPSEGEPSFPGSRSVPTVDDKSVYFVGSFGRVHCIDRQSQKATWTVKMSERYSDAKTPNWGYAQPAVVLDDIVFVTPFGSEVGVAAWDKKTGKEVWRSGGIGNSHAAPTVLTIDGQKQIALVTRDGDKGLVTSYHPKNGKVLWQTDLYYNKIPIPTVTKVSDSKIFVTGGYDCGSKMLSLTKKGDGYEVGELWAIDKGTQIHPPFLINDHLYFLANENSNHRPSAKRKTGGLSCWTLEGKEIWRSGNEPFMGRGGSILADGMLIIQDGEKGTLRLVEPTQKNFKLLAEANVFKSDLKNRKDQQFWSPMALSNGRLLMRGQDRLLCIDLRK